MNEAPEAVLVTGAAGFIGCAVSLALLARGDRVIGIDNRNAYYDVALKDARLARLRKHAAFDFEPVDVSHRPALDAVVARYRPTRIVHLAAQAGVRYSFENPQSYIDSNVTGFLNVLEAAKSVPGAHLVYASSSSVYGANTKQPFSIDDAVDHPISLYGATKRANELMAFTYAHAFGLRATGLRFFTVYGPWGRPDMAAIKFTRAIFEGRPIEVYGHGEMRRDFTYIDDIAAGVVAILDAPASQESVAHRVYNLGNHHPEALMDFIRILGESAGREPILDMQPMQPGDVRSTYADIDATTRDFRWRPTTSIAQGLPKLVDWCREYYGYR